MNYYEHHIGDHLKKTVHLSAVEEGVYRRLLDRYYTTEQPLPADVRECCKLARATTKAERDAVRDVLKDFFLLRDDGHHQNRADEEIARFKDKQAKATRSANARWSAQRAHSNGNANASSADMPTHCEGNANASETDMRTHCEGNAPRARPQTPDTNNQINTPQPPSGGKRRSRKSEVEPEGFADFWAAYPRKVGKDAARNAFEKRSPDSGLLTRMLAAIAEQAKSAQWLREGGQYIPHPSTWLNEGRWQDEVGGTATGAPALAVDDPLRAQIAALPPDWWRLAGFESKWDAEASRCNWMNYTEFRDRKRMVSPEGATA
ncbi:DUF1376 domain-containing protein [Alicycliphilus denitrificans]|uniref:DUF1376 domain-containing protein n=1 Tax=Alicycliphilus denitrificans TaxID=179636 RepID=UPI00384F8660